MAPSPLNASVGQRLRALRLARTQKQNDVAHQLEISPAYLNLIEKGKRTVPFPLLWRALRLYGEDPETFMASVGEGRVDETLKELLDEPLVKSLQLDVDALTGLSAEPRLAGTIAALFNLYKNTRTQLENTLAQLDAEKASGRGVPERPGARRAPAGGKRPAAGGGEVPHYGGYSPFDEVTDFLESHRNWFGPLEAEAERLRKDFALGRAIHSPDLVRIAEKGFGLKVSVEPFAGGTSVVRHLDRARGTLQLSPSLTEHALKFQIGTTLGLLLLERDRLGAQLVGDARPRHAETARLLEVHLANYFAGALLLPYGDFFQAAQRTRYDVDVMAQHFGVSYETVAHRLCNLADPRRRGVPFHFLRADVAGNISKRYSASGLRLPAQGGSCPKWAVHTAFLSPSVIARQYSAMPDGEAYFCFARVVAQPIEGSLVRGSVYSIGMGVQAADGKHLAYANALPPWQTSQLAKISVPTGITCRFCERTDCNQRAAASYKFAFAFDHDIKKDNFFSPLLDREKR